MAIKIKKKSPESSTDEMAENDELGSEASDDSGEYGKPELVQEHEDIDVVIPEFVQKKPGIFDNPQMVFGMGIGAVAVILAGYYGWKFVENQAVDNSAHLNGAFNASWKFTSDGPEIKALSERGITATFEPFENASKKSEAVYAAADAASKAGKDELANSARLLKAGAALQLGKYDEAIELYGNVLSSAKASFELIPARQGLSDAYAAKKEWEKAIEQVDAIASTDVELGKAMKYRKARLLESAGKTKEAKDLYHEIVENDPQSQYKSDIERRLATL